MLIREKKMNTHGAFLQCQSMTAPPMALNAALAMEFPIMKRPRILPLLSGVTIRETIVMNGASTSALPNWFAIAEITT